jgi:hypothetical protein
MTEASQGDRARTIRVRLYRDAVQDLRAPFRLAPGEELRGALRRAALAALPRTPGWAIRVVSLQRTESGEKLALVLDGLARREMGGGDFAAAVAATEDGAMAVLAATALQARPLDRLAGALGAPAA